LAYLLMAVNVGVFIVQSVLDHYRIFPFTATFALSLEGLARRWFWQLLTFQFLHGGLIHLLCNLLAIYFFGRALEEVIGARRMLRLYLASGAVGGICQMLLAYASPQYFGGAVVGASAGAFGLVAAFAMLFPHRVLTLLVFFVLPVSLRARTLLWLSLGLAVFGVLVPDGIVADGAHLGGILTGVAYVHWVLQGRGWPARLPAFRPGVRRPRELVRTVSSGRPYWSNPAGAAGGNLAPDEFISREVDPILDKISAQGIQSLTAHERDILEAARSRMPKR
jgi:membrane associated rhomboid family serine protease